MSKYQQRPGEPKHAGREAGSARGREAPSRSRGVTARGGGARADQAGWEPGSRRPRLPDNGATITSSPRTAPLGSVAEGSSQSSSHHGPGDGRIPPGDQLRARTVQLEPLGACSAACSGNGAGSREKRGGGGWAGAASRGKSGGPASRGGGGPAPRSRLCACPRGMSPLGLGGPGRSPGPSPPPAPGPQPALEALGPRPTNLCAGEAAGRRDPAPGNFA